MIRLTAIIVITAAAAVWLLINTLSATSVEQAMSRNAVHKAGYWAHYMAERVPDLEQLVETGRPTEAQKDAIRQVREIGDVFRFKLFDAQARLVLVSDDAAIMTPAGVAEEYDPEALDVVQTRKPIVAVFNGTEKVDRPDHYAEAYVPLTDAAGRITAVVEVYVNVTRAQTYFEESFEQFGLIVSAASALLFLIPAGAFAIQRRHASESRREAEYLARHDALTGLINRAEFRRRAEKLQAEGRLTSLCYIDVDKFKFINDTYGHAVGDAFLAQVGRILTENSGPEDLVARFGGDEFVLAFSGAAPDAIDQVIREIIKRSAQSIVAGGVSLTSSVSIGVSNVTATQTVSDALAHADAALYFAKSEGRNQFAIYGDDMGEVLRKRIELEALVRKAAETDAFTIEYQPLVAGDDFQVIGYEALLRLKTEAGVPVSPMDFVPLAEDMGLIDQIGRWVIETATREISALAGDVKIA